MSALIATICWLRVARSITIIILWTNIIIIGDSLLIGSVAIKTQWQDFSYQLPKRWQVLQSSITFWIIEKKMNISNVLPYVDCETVQGLNSNNFSKHPVATYGDSCISVLKFQLKEFNFFLLKLYGKFHNSLFAC